MTDQELIEHARQAAANRRMLEPCRTGAVDAVHELRRLMPKWHLREAIRFYFANRDAIIGSRRA